MNKRLLSKNIFWLLGRFKWSQNELGRRSGVPQPTITRILSGESNSPRRENIEKIAKSFNVSVEQLYNEDLKSIYIDSLNTGQTRESAPIYHQKATINRKLLALGNVSNIPDRDKYKDIPVIDSVKAGEFSEIVDLYEPGYADDWLSTNAKCSDRTFALIVSGDSMEPRFKKGDRIIVDPEVSPENGDFVVARHNGDNEATFKRYVKDGSKHILIPLNPMYSRIELDENTEIVGVAIERIPEAEKLK